MASKTASVSWKDLLLPGCFGPNKSTHKIHDSNKRICQGQQRVSLSELSELISPASLSNLSGSLVDVHVFSLKELETITRNFSRQLGKGGFGPVYKGFVEGGFRPGLKAQVVAVKVLDLDCSKQGHREWLAEVVFLGQLKHPHLVNLMGYCCEDQHRLLVYEYMEGGNLHKHLFESIFPALPWLTRLKIAVGAAKGLAFLHEEEKHVIYRDFKSSNILLDSGYNAKLSDFGFAIDGPNDGNTHVSTHIMGTEGYVAPEYVMTGHLTTMSDVFSFGVVLLELLTGRKAIDKIRSGREKILVEWAKPRIKDPYKLHGMMDPKLEGQYSTVGARKVATLAHQCLSCNPKSRPRMSFVVRALEPLLDLKDIPVGPFVYIVPNQGSESDQRKDK